MNKILISGFLGKDPELKKVSEKFTACNFSIPYTEKYGEEKRTHWFNCQASNQTADFVAKYFKQGDGIECEGKLLTRTYNNKDGVKVTITFIQVDNVSFPPARKVETKQEPSYKNEGVEVDVPKTVINEAGVEQDEDDMPF